MQCTQRECRNLCILQCGDIDVLEENLAHQDVFGYFKQSQKFQSLIHVNVCNWDRYLRLMQRLLPWFFNYDRQKYSRHCWPTLMKLPETHPSLHNAFPKGNVFVRRIPETFVKLPPHQVIEETINKNQKGFCGIKGLLNIEGTVQQWIFSSNFVSSINADLTNSYLCDENAESIPRDLN